MAKRRRARGAPIVTVSAKSISLRIRTFEFEGDPKVLELALHRQLGSVQLALPAGGELVTVSRPPCRQCGRWDHHLVSCPRSAR